MAAPILGAMTPYRYDDIVSQFAHKFNPIFNVFFQFFIFLALRAAGRGIPDAPCNFLSLQTVGRDILDAPPTGAAIPSDIVSLRTSAHTGVAIPSVPVSLRTSPQTGVAIPRMNGITERLVILSGAQRSRRIRSLSIIVRGRILRLPTVAQDDKRNDVIARPKAVAISRHSLPICIT